MKKIPLDRDKKLMLIRWLQQNQADTDELRALEDLHHYTKEETDQHMMEMLFSHYPKWCELLKEMGYCYPRLCITKGGIYDSKYLEIWKKSKEKS